MEIKVKEFSREVLTQAMQCKTVEELIVIAKEIGEELTEEQAQAYLDEFEDFELDNEALKRVFGISCYSDCDCYGDCGEHDCPTYDCGYDCGYYTRDFSLHNNIF